MQIMKLAALLFGVAVSGVLVNPASNDGSLVVRGDQGEKVAQANQAENAQNAGQHAQVDQKHEGNQEKSWWPQPWPRPRPRPNNWCPPWASWCRQPNRGYCQYGGISQCVNNYCNPTYDSFWDRYGTCTSGYLAGCQCDKCGGSTGGHVGSCSASNGCFGQNGRCTGGQYAGCPCQQDAWVWKA